MNGLQLFLRTLFHALLSSPLRFRSASIVSFTLRFLRAIDLGLKVVISDYLAP